SATSVRREPDRSGRAPGATTPTPAAPAPGTPAVAAVSTSPQGGAEAPGQAPATSSDTGGAVAG
ncbi:MAG TPA: hypothetical protein VG366_07675, partial [Solirubrobacteraceae bacterium]|nr:hypothetical protein [Solirubrobacteraceae bacterium]